MAENGVNNGVNNSVNNKEFLQLTCREFADKLASREPVPGGGGAAAYTGALGMALLSMVAELTVGKKKYADVEAEVIAINGRCRELREALLAGVEADAAAFRPLSEAYALPSGTDEERAHKAAVLDEVSRRAAELPLLGAEQAAEGLVLAERLAAIGSRLVISDAACGASLLLASLKAFSWTVRINLGAIKDREYVAAIEARLAELAEVGAKCEAEAVRLAGK